MAKLLPVGCTSADVSPYREQALKDGNISETVEGRIYHIYIYTWDGTFNTNGNFRTGGFYYKESTFWGANNVYDAAKTGNIVYHLFLINSSTGNTQETVSGTVVETTAEAATEAEEEQQLLPPHIHDYHWEAVTDPTIDQDGEMQYRCSCGDVKEKQPIPAAQIYVKGLYGAVKEAAPNGTVEYDAGKLHTISDYILNKMSERSDVTVNVKFEYKGVKYQITFPAGTDYTKVLTDEPTMYGYFGVAAELGLAVTEL